MFLEVAEASRKKERSEYNNTRQKNPCQREQQNEQIKGTTNIRQTKFLLPNLTSSYSSSSQKTVTKKILKINNNFSSTRRRCGNNVHRTIISPTTTNSLTNLTTTNNNNSQIIIYLLIFSYLLAAVHCTLSTLSSIENDANVNLFSTNNNNNNIKKVNKLSNQLRIRNYTKLPSTTKSPPVVVVAAESSNEDVNNVDDDDESGESTFEASTKVARVDSALIDIFKMRLLKLLEIEQAPTPNEINLNENPIPEPILKELIQRSEVEQANRRRNLRSKGKRSRSLDDFEEDRTTTKTTTTTMDEELIRDELEKVVEAIVNDQDELENDAVRFNGSVVQQVTLLPKKCFFLFPKFILLYILFTNIELSFYSFLFNS